MDKHLDTTMALRAFEVIREKGEKNGDAYFYNGMFAESSADEYTAIIHDQRSRLILGFHNTFRIETPSELDRDEFLHNMSLIAQE